MEKMEAMRRGGGRLCDTSRGRGGQQRRSAALLLHKSIANCVNTQETKDKTDITETIQEDRNAV